MQERFSHKKQYYSVLNTHRLLNTCTHLLDRHELSITTQSCMWGRREATWSGLGVLWPHSGKGPSQVQFGLTQHWKTGSGKAKQRGMVWLCVAKSAEGKQVGSQMAKETSDASAPQCTAGNFFQKKYPRCRGLSRNPWTSFIKETSSAATSIAVEVSRTVEECQTAPQETEDVTAKNHVCSTSGRRRLAQQPIIQRLVVFVWWTWTYIKVKIFLTILYKL